MHSSGESRLQKLLKLLENGTNEKTRKAAAKHIGDVAKLHPAQLPSILRKVHRYLSSKRWECRVAAAESVGLMAEHFVQHTVHDLEKLSATEGGCQVSLSTSSQLANLKLHEMLSSGSTLSRGKQEHDNGAAVGFDQQKQIMEKLGADFGHFVSDSDLADILSDRKDNPSETPCRELKRSISLSARQRNVLKRKARTEGLLESQKSIQSVIKEASSDDFNDSHIIPSVSSCTEEEDDEDHREWNTIVSGGWPFRRICDEACVEALDPSWEVRHGAALLLREVLRSQAAAAGMCLRMEEEPSGWMLPGKSGHRRLKKMGIKEINSSITANRTWIEGCVRTLLTVLSMDRVGDYVSDQMVAPVRETAAQALGAALQALPVPAAKVVLQLLRDMIQHTSWEVRHGGLLGLKYLLAARIDISEEILSLALPSIMVGLDDACDDVRAAAAEVMEPVALQLSTKGPQAVELIRKKLWGILLDMDDLSSATASVLQLLWQLYSQPGSFEAGIELSELVPRLWPFFRHNLTTVRMATVQCLEQLLIASLRNTVWLDGTLLNALTFVFINLLMESKEQIIAKSEEVWVLLLDRCSDRALHSVSRSSAIDTFFRLACTPLGRAIDDDLINDLRSMASSATSESVGDQRPRKRPKLDDDGGGGGKDEHIVGSQWVGNPTRMRLAVTRALGQLAARLERCNVLITPEVLSHLTGSSATSRMSACLVIWFWIHEKKKGGMSTDEGDSSPVPQELVDQVYCLLCVRPACIAASCSPDLYQEEVPHFAKLRREWSVMQNQCSAAGLCSWMCSSVAEDISVDRICELVTQVPVSEEYPVVLGLQHQILSTARTLTLIHENLHMATTACAAASAIGCGCLPEKLNCIIQPLMASVRREGEHLLQELLADALAELICICTTRKPSPSKMLKNICRMACCDPLEVPSPCAGDCGPCDSNDSGLMSVLWVGKQFDPNSPEMVASCVSRRGSEAVLTALAARLRGELFEQLPQLWVHIVRGLQSSEDSADSTSVQMPENELSDVINSLQIMKVVGSAVCADLLPKIVGILPHVCKWLKHGSPAVRLAAARCAARLADAHTENLMPPILEIVIPELSSRAHDPSREGAAVLIYHLVESLGEKLVTYTVLLIVPLLARMCDPVKNIRLVSTACFGFLVALLPLAQGLDPPKGLSDAQHQDCLRDKKFLDQLLDVKKVEDYQPPVTVRATLRGYQQEGVNWLAFLRQFGLHGVLADDMGLGKTIQAAITIASSTVDNIALYERTKKEEDIPLASLVVCPATLVPHWAHEIDHYLEDSPLRTLQYVGTPAERVALQEKFQGYNLLVASYESLRTDVSWFSSKKWNYCVLDEGQLIRNPSTQVSRACKQVLARNRLILSGTPIQNNVLELWSLFDFLMPGFLGTQKDFMTKYGKAVQAARYSKKGSAEADAGLLALGSLHKQVMPFVMRRTKDEVLSDLPRKIVQDIYCELSSLQKQLYEDFAKSEASDELEATISSTGDSDQNPHAFHSIQYLRRLCGHPLLVLNWDIAAHRLAAQEVLGSEVSTLEEARSRLQDTSQSPKLQALKELLEQCGITGSPSAGSALGHEEEDGCTPLHRILVFAQLKQLLDVVESSILNPAGIAYLRLDGNVESRKRMQIVQKFNSDPTIGVMLLTTKVGGLGLNLTSADTVVFLEHDWNPMNDLQAMDRVHRLGQERTVNVYRILTRGTLEEKIMGLQQFKMAVANSVVNKDNMSMDTMDTTKLLDLFTYTPSGGGSMQAQPKELKKSSKLNSFLDSIEELWDEKQYEDEFSLQTFIGKISGSS